MRIRDISEGDLCAGHLWATGPHVLRAKLSLCQAHIHRWPWHEHAPSDQGKQQHNGTANVAVSAAPIVARLAEVELWAALTSVPILPRRRLMVAREEPLAAIVNWRFARRALVDDCLVAEAGGAVPAAVPRGVGGVDVLCLARVAAAGGNAFAPVDTRPLRNTSLAARVACAGSAGLNKFSCPTVAPVQTELARLSC